jgi:hypothetical protein
MTNPNNAIGTNGAFSGRTSPNALNDLAAAFSRGIVSGWTCSPKNGMTVQLGGSASVRDTALAEDNAGNKLTINNRSGAPIDVTLDGAPSTNDRIDAIVAYVDNPSTGDGTTTDNPSACGIIAVKGTVAARPSAPTEAQIRAAITTDGATGGIAYYVVLATVLVGTNVTTIGSGVITQGSAAQSIAALADNSVSTNKIADGAVTSDKVDWSTLETGTPQSLEWSGAASGTFTAPGCGFVVVQTASASNATCYLDLNNETIGRAQGGASAFTWVPMIAFVSKGDVIKARTSDNGGNAQIVPSGCFFVPIGD